MTTNLASLSLARLAAAWLCAVLLAAAWPAQARDERQLQPLSRALQTPRIRQVIGDMVLRFGRASADGADFIAHDVVAEGDASVVVDALTRKDPSPGDEALCLRAFEEALGKLVMAARKAGAASVVGIVSDYRGQVLDDSRNYECHAGTFHSFVTLQGQFSRTIMHTRPLPPATGFADLNDIKALPASDAARERYAHFLTLPKPRAFVLLEDGNWRFYSGDPEAMTKSLDWCARQAVRCWLYAVDDRVVWSNDLDKRISVSGQLGGADVSTPAPDKDEHQ